MLLLALTFSAHAGVKATTPSGDLDQVYAPRRVALLIGVDQYDDPALQGLSFAAKDASDLGAVLGDKASGDYDEVTVLHGRESREEIVAAIEKATSHLQRDDTFLLYLAGHGTLELDPVDGTRLYFLPSDGKLSEPQKTAVPVSWLEQEMGQIAPRRRVLILDTCHNGRGRSSVSNDTETRLRGMRGNPPPPSTVAQVSESEALLYAADYWQPAMETPELQNGVYTHFLIEALTTDRASADLNGDGLVDVLEAHAFARDGTIRYTGGVQVPRAEYSVVGNEEIFLAGDPTLRQQAEKALFSAYQGLLASAKLFVDGTARGELPGVVPVEPGRHDIAVRTADGRTLLDRSMTVRAGETTSIEDLLRPRATWSAGVGAVAWQGPGAEYVVPFAPELQVGWSPARATMVVYDVHARFSASSGPVSDVEGGHAAVQTAAIGAFAGTSPWPDRLSVGPELEVGGLRRTSLFHDAAVSQGAFTVDPGLRARLDLPLADRSSLALAYDARVVPWMYKGDWTLAVVHGVEIGGSFR